MKASAIASGWIWLRGVRAAALLCALGLAGCTVNGPSPLAGSLASPTGTRAFGPTVAFESVDGPPPQVFDRLRHALESESASGNFTIVSREAPASYRVRSYLSAQVSRRGGTTIAWVWDVYDRDQQRALRLSGEESAGKTGRDAWTAADDQMMRRIAQAGLRGLAGLIDGTLPAQDQPAPPLPQPGGPAVASADDDAIPTGARVGNALAFNSR
jgi:hypothetical protein